MSVVRVKDTEINTAYGLSKNGGVSFYAADELPLAIAESVNKSKGYYFPKETIEFTITLTLMPDSNDSAVTTLDQISLEDTIPSVVVLTSSSATISGAVTSPDPVVDVNTNKVTITGITLDDTHTVATVKISGTIKDSPF